jgi:hypothetical protein
MGLGSVRLTATSEYEGELVKDRTALKRKTSRANRFGLGAGRLLGWGSTQGLTPTSDGLRLRWDVTGHGMLVNPAGQRVQVF